MKTPFMSLSDDDRASFLDELKKAIETVMTKLPGDGAYVFVFRTPAPEGSRTEDSLGYFSNEPNPVEAANMLHTAQRGVLQHASRGN